MTGNNGNDTAKQAGPEFVEIRHTFIDRFRGDKEVTAVFRFKGASSAVVERTQQRMNKKLAPAMRNLCVSCVHPDDKARMLEMFETYPGLATTFGNAILEAAGFGDLGN